MKQKKKRNGSGNGKLSMCVCASERAEYSVERSVEGMLGDLLLQSVPKRRCGVLNRKRDYPVSRRH
jgi:hypothetical protein